MAKVYRFVLFHLPLPCSSLISRLSFKKDMMLSVLFIVSLCLVNNGIVAYLLFPFNAAAKRRRV